MPVVAVVDMVEMAEMAETNGPQTHPPQYGTGPVVGGAAGLEGGFGGIGRGYLSIDRKGTDNPYRGKLGYKWPPGVEGPAVPYTSP